MQLTEAQWKDLFLSARIEFIEDEDALLLLTGFALGVGFGLDKRMVNVKKVKIQAHKEINAFLLQWFTDRGFGEEIKKLIA